MQALRVEQSHKEKLSLLPTSDGGQQASAGEQLLRLHFPYAPEPDLFRTKPCGEVGSKGNSFRDRGALRSILEEILESSL